MTKMMRPCWMLAVGVLVICPVAFSQPTGKAIYQAKCQQCHGTTGLANSGVGKLMKVKPVSDPEVKAMPEAEMIREVREGAGRMQAYKGSLSEAQIRAAVAYFRTFIK